ncbi:hypothetical protein [Leptolyngbya sp. ST-U4]|uniref:hypothetical protein n=1 Tax=Leptolyngbya sp. ST-U4 TaxID=2933912 RepID=UPI003297CF78
MEEDTNATRQRRQREAIDLPATRVPQRDAIATASAVAKDEAHAMLRSLTAVASLAKWVHTHFW